MPAPTAAGVEGARAISRELPTGVMPKVRFYGFDEVERPAVPTDDWNLGIDTLDELGVSRVVFEVLVSDQGEVVGCAVMEPSELAEEAKSRLEAQLRETQLQPAVRAGVPVASIRRIEMNVAFSYEPL
jgi:hypothetical protein